MSRFDKEHEAEWRRAAERDAAMFVVGATVYRVKYDRIQAGIVRAVGRCNDPDAGIQEGGSRPYYGAGFLNAPGCNEEWVAQTYARYFFATEAEARRALERELEVRIEDKRRDVRRLEALLASVRAGSQTP